MRQSFAPAGHVRILPTTRIGRLWVKVVQVREKPQPKRYFKKEPHNGVQISARIPTLMLLMACNCLSFKYLP